MVAVQQTKVGEACLEQIGLLHAEISQGMAAISNDALSAFEESLWRQEVLCVGLKHLLPELRASQADGQLLARVQVSITALHDLNRTYALLLQQAQSSNALLLRLCQSRLPSISPHTTGITGVRCSLEA